MKKDKGFTLVELIGVIVIIGVLALIAVPVYNAIQKRVLEQQYKNVVGLIETKAIKYAEEKKILIVDVDTLITDGYLDPDDDKYIYDPRNKNILNCYAVDIEFVNNSYIAKLNTEKKYENDNGCDKNALLADKSNLKIFGNEQEINSDDYWFNTSTVKLTAKLNNNNIENGNFLWTSSNGERSTEKTIEINVAKLLSATYTLRYENVDNEMIYEKSVKVNIDTEKPIVFADRVNISEPTKYTATKTISVNASDQNGSGIAGYYIGTSECNISGITYENNPNQQSNQLYTKTVDKNNSYIVCVKDKAGNVTKLSTNIIIDHIDITPPTCSVIKSNTYSSSGVTVTINCSDGDGSGVASCPTVDTGVKSNKTYTVTDNAGISNTCTVNVNSESRCGGYRSYCNGYGTKTDSSCGCKTQGTCKTYSSCPNSSCTCKTTQTIESCTKYKRCEAAGCETYNRCSKCDCATYNRCSACGVDSTTVSGSCGCNSKSSGSPQGTYSCTATKNTCSKVCNAVNGNPNGSGGCSTKTVYKRCSKCSCDTYKRCSKCSCDTPSRGPECGCTADGTTTTTVCTEYNSCQSSSCPCSEYNCAAYNSCTDYNNCTSYGSYCSSYYSVYY